VSVRVAAVMAAVLAVGCTGDEPVAGPAVSLMKQSVAGCYAVMTVNRPAAELGLTDLCDGQGDARLYAGVDLVRAVIDYGDISFSGTTAAPGPVVVVTIDGKPADVMPALLDERRSNGHTFFLATFTTPNVVSSSIQIAVRVNAGFATTVPTILSTVQPIQVISVLTRTSAGCSAVVSGSAPAAALGLASPCPMPLPVPRLNAGTDQVQVVVDYGPIDVPGATKVPAPALAVLVDGKDIASPVTVSTTLRAGGHVFFIATFTAPPMLSSNVRIAVTATPGATMILPDIFTLAAAPLSITVLECAQLGCERAGAVGTVHARIAIPGEVPQSIVVHNLIDGLPISDSNVPITTELGVGETVTTVEVAVPAAPDGAAWNIVAQLGPIRKAANQITIRRPVIVATLSCGASCTVAAGARLGLEVTAPKDIRSRQAIISTALGGVPILAGSTLDLTAIDIGAGTASASQTLTAPATPGTWSIDVSVAGYRATTLSVTVQ
jgi:hypothetical protein